MVEAGSECVPSREVRCADGEQHRRAEIKGLMDQRHEPMARDLALAELVDDKQIDTSGDSAARKAHDVLQGAMIQPAAARF